MLTTENPVVGLPLQLEVWADSCRSARMHAQVGAATQLAGSASHDAEQVSELRTAYADARRMRVIAAAISIVVVGCGAAQPDARSQPMATSSGAPLVENGVLVREVGSAATCEPAPASTASAALRVVHDDEVSAFRLIGATYSVDGRPFAKRGRDANIESSIEARAVVLDDETPAGCHLLEVQLDYFTRYPTPWGYDYVLRVKSAHAVTIPPEGTTVRIVSDDSKGGVTTPVEERFEVRWETDP